MRTNTLSIEIQKPIGAVFRFTINPKNTPKWIPSIRLEKASPWPVRIGTIYRQKIRGNRKSALVVTGLKKNRQLDFHLINGAYTCSYRYKKMRNGTGLTYSEENGVDGRINNPMRMSNLEKLKKLIEK